MKKNFRVYEIAKSKKERNALGIWQGIKDHIAFTYFDTIDGAKARAYAILTTTTEKAVAVEAIDARILYIITIDGIETLRGYSIAIYPEARKKFIRKHSNYTIEKTTTGIIVFTYYDLKEDIQKEVWQSTKDVYIQRAIKGAIGRQRVLNKGIAKSAHSLSIRKALKEGKAIPLEVLKDYPNLKKQAGFISLQAVYSILIVGALIFALIIGNHIIDAGKKIIEKRNAQYEDIIQ